MSVKSAGGWKEIRVNAVKGGVDIRFSRTQQPESMSGSFETEAVETLITELAAAIGKDVTLSEPPAPKLILRDLEPGTAFRFGSNPENPVYVKLTGERLWSNFTKRINKIGADSIREVFIVEEES